MTNGWLPPGPWRVRVAITDAGAVRLVIDGPIGQIVGDACAPNDFDAPSASPVARSWTRAAFLAWCAHFEHAAPAACGAW